MTKKPGFGGFWETQEAFQEGNFKGTEAMLYRNSVSLLTVHPTTELTFQQFFPHENVRL